MEDSTRKSQIQTFYSGKTVFLTGGTGFLGKMLLETLLRTCPDIQRIYLLVRERKGETPADRLQSLLQNKVFSRLKTCDPGFGEKLTVVHGDLLTPRLGLSQDDVTQLSQDVEIVIHSAATLKFDEELKVAVATNVTATRELCLLAQGMDNLKAPLQTPHLIHSTAHHVAQGILAARQAHLHYRGVNPLSLLFNLAATAFVYVSTAYSNCELDCIAERVCPPPVSPDRLVNMTHEQLMEGSASLLGSKPNTYIFTKCAAEEVINRFKTSLPVAILRPSIVTASVNDPFPGWVDNSQGATGVITSCAVGLLRTMRGRIDAVANLVPVDWTANSIIVLAHSVAESADCWHRPGQDGVPVVNMVSNSSNSITWLQFKSMILTECRISPPLRCYWYPLFIRTSSPLAEALHTALLHDLPSWLHDLQASLTGRPVRLGKLNKKLTKYLNAISYFSTRHFVFEERNAALLWEGLEPRDQQLFPFNMADIRWQPYFSEYVRGCRHYLLGESPHTIPQAQQRLRRLHLIHNVLKYTVVALGIAVSYTLFWCIVS